MCSSDLLHRIVASYDRRLASLILENSALRARALETKDVLAKQEQTLRTMAMCTPDVAALEQTIAEQTEHLDALTERLGFMSDRETELRSMLVDAHDQLVRRDESFGPLRHELEARGAVIDELDQALKERTAWAERMVAEAEKRGALLEELHNQLAAATNGSDGGGQPGHRTRLQRLQGLAKRVWRVATS